MVDRPGPNRGHSTRQRGRLARSTSPSVEVAGDRVGPFVRPCRRWHGRQRDPSDRCAGCLAAGCGAVAGAAPVAGPRAGPRRAADGRRRCCSAGRSSRCRRSASRSPSVWWLWAVRRVERGPPAQPRPAPADGRVPGRDARPRRSRCCRASSRYDTTLFSVHMVQHVLLMLVAAPLLALAAPITLVLRLSSPRDAPSLAPAGPPLAGRAVPGPPGRRPG